MGIVKIPISIYVYDKKYYQQMEEYNDKMDEYYRKLDSKDDSDPLLSQLCDDHEELVKPKQPEGRKGEGELVIKEDLIVGYENLGEVIHLILDNSKVAVPEPAYYIIKKNDKIIERLDNILENN